MENRPTRKQYRLPKAAYTQFKKYFVTINTHNKECILSYLSESDLDKVGAWLDEPSNMRLSNIGAICEDAIERIPSIYSNVSIDAYVIMPNHIHMIVSFQPNDEMLVSKTSLSAVISQFKRYVTKNAKVKVWQKLYYDHIIRDKADYSNTVSYIYNNPRNWILKGIDCHDDK